MDASTSIGDTLELAKRGVLQFVRRMRTVDRAGIIVFPRFDRPKEVDRRILPFTNDTTAIQTFVRQASTARGTPLNQALLKAIEMTSAEDSLRRRTIIVYTDGINDNNDKTAVEVIQQANRFNIPIFTIAVGRQTDVDTLMEIAAQTGGLFFEAGPGQRFEGIYRQTSDLLQNKYDLTVTQTVSPAKISAGDTLIYTLQIENLGPSDAFDVVVTDSLPEELSALNWPGIQVGNALTHTLPSLGSNETAEISFAAIVTTARKDTLRLRNTAVVAALCDIDSSNNAVSSILVVEPTSDISVVKFARTDSFQVTAGDTVWFVRAGETFTYYIEVANADSVDAFDVVLRDILPDSVSVAGADSVLEWAIGTLPALADTVISLDATVAAKMPMGTTAILNQAEVLASNEHPDSLSNNLSAFSVFHVLLPDTLTDLSVSKSVQTDSFTVWSGDTTWYVDEGETFTYSIQVVNQDTVAALDIVVEDVLPDSVRSGSLPSGGTLSWQIARLAGMSDTLLSFDAIMAPQMPVGANELLNRVHVSASNEDSTLLADNFATATAFNFVAPPPPDTLTDISITKSVRTDSFAVFDSDTTWYVEEGETFTYALQVINQDTVAALDVVVEDFLPDSVRSEFIPPGGTLSWQIPRLTALRDTLLSFAATLAPKMPVGINELLNRVQISASNEDSTLLADNFATATAFNFVAPPPPDTLTDISVMKRVQTDSFVVSNGDTIWYVDQGNAFTYSIHVVNQDTVDALDVVVEDVLPDSVHSGAVPAGGTLSWQIPRLPALRDTVLRFDATLALVMPLGLNELLNQVQVSASNEDSTRLADNFATAVVFNLALPPADTLTDISVRKSVQTDSFSVSNGDTTWYVDEGETFRYFVHVVNEDTVDARDVLIADMLPDSVRSDTVPAGGTLSWQITRLPALRDTLVSFDATLAPKMPPGQNEITNHVQVSAANEDSTQLDDNFASQSALNVVVLPPPRYDLEIAKSANPRTVLQGQDIEFTIEVINHGPEVASQVTVRDFLPDSLEFVAFGEASNGANENGTLVWTLDSLASGQSTFLEFTARCSSELEFVEAFTQTNVATVSAPFDTNPDNNEARVPVVCMPKFTNCEKIFTLDRNVFEPGRSGQLTISVAVDFLNNVKIGVFDITGYPIKSVVEGEVSSGPRTFFWDGRADDGNSVGSGVYLIIFRDNLLNGRILECVQKVIVRR